MIGFLAKEPTLMFLPLLFLFVLFFESPEPGTPLADLLRMKNFPHLKSTLITVAPLFVLSLLLYIFYRQMSSPTWTGGDIPVFNYLITQPFVMVHYFNNFLIPANLVVDTDWQALQTIFDDRFFAGMVFIILMTGLAFYASKNIVSRPIAFGILWFFITLIPTSSIFPLSEVLNDHRTFFPYIGLVIAATWSIALLFFRLEKRIMGNPLRKILLIILACGFLFAHAMGVHGRNEVWQSGETLWLEAVQKSPGNGRALMNYANTQMQKGRLDVALDYFNRALKLLPNYNYLHINLGVVKGAMNKAEEAEYHFRYALTLRPDHPDGYFYYANWLKSQGRFRESITLTQQGLQKSPGHISLNKLLSEIQPLENTVLLSKLDMAIAEAGKNPTPENYINLSLEFYYAGKFEKSIEAAEEALKLKPGYPIAYNNICSAYNQLKMYDKAIDACEKALTLQPDFELAKNNLSVAKQSLEQQKQK
jgi:tetratricopeptide (TPR) repeat protein